MKQQCINLTEWVIHMHVYINAHVFYKFEEKVYVLQSLEI